MIVDRTSDLSYNGRERLPFEHRLNTLAKEVDEMPPAQRYMCSTVFLAAIHDTVAETLPDLTVLYPSMQQSEMWKGVADDARQVTEYIKKVTGGGKRLERVEKKQYQSMIVGQFQREAQAVVESTTKALKDARLQLSMALEDAEARLNAAKQNLDSATIHTMQSNLENIKATTLRGMCSKLDHLGDPEYTILKLGSQTLTREKVYAMDADMLLERLLENAKALNPSKPEAFIPTMITLKDIWGVAMAVEVPRGLRVSDEMFSGNNTEDEGEGEEDEGSSSGYTYNGQGTA
ncbi:hypothetical protein FRB94_013714 [Tulasnella sp. JGI-2019a]|nr:hypothetical protein FRB94_013714 [Tulasnella sp. JGI-2019a]